MNPPNDPFKHLFEAVRPRTFEEVAGNVRELRRLTALISRGILRPGFMFYGPPGCGKSTLGRITASTIACTKRGTRCNPCGDCRGCKFYVGCSAELGEGTTSRNCTDYDIKALRRDLVDAYYALDEPFPLLLEQIEDTPKLQRELLTWLEDDRANLSVILTTCTVDKLDDPLCQRLFVIRVEPPDEAAMLRCLARASEILGEEQPTDEELRTICRENSNFPRLCLRGLFERFALRTDGR